jgi:23S rRNA pseudouridine1911/1915/1917 synthase
LTTDLHEEFISLTVTEDDQLKYPRLDHYLTALCPNLSRTFIKKLFEQQLIVIDANDKSPQPKNLTLKKMPPIGTQIRIEVPPPLPCDLLAENIPLEILYEDPHLLLVNKPAGMVTHPAPGNRSGTLVNALLFHYKNLDEFTDTNRPGIVHRLDKGTSGVMVVAKTRKCHEEMVLMFSQREITRLYNCLVVGTAPAASGRIATMFGRHPKHRLKMCSTLHSGKQAATNYRLINSFGNLHQLELKLESGRTHQIRVHLAEQLRLPVLGDQLYGNPKQDLGRLPSALLDLLKEYPHPLLHAKFLAFKHPITSKLVEMEVPPPSIYQKSIELAAQIQQETV